MQTSQKLADDGYTLGGVRVPKDIVKSVAPAGVSSNTGRRGPKLLVSFESVRQLQNINALHCSVDPCFRSCVATFLFTTSASLLLINQNFNWIDICLSNALGHLGVQIADYSQYYVTGTGDLVLSEQLDSREGHIVFTTTYQGARAVLKMAADSHDSFHLDAEAKIYNHLSKLQG